MNLASYGIAPIALNTFCPPIEPDNTSATLTQKPVDGWAGTIQGLAMAEPHYKAWYKTARWRKLRWSILVRDLFQCSMCNRIERNTSLLVADHKIPHKGNLELFWDESNLHCLCKLCHDSDKQRIEAGGKAKPRIGLDGWPIDTGGTV